MIEPIFKSMRSIDFTLIVNIYTCWPHVDQLTMLTTCWTINIKIISTIGTWYTWFKFPCISQSFIITLLKFCQKVIKIFQKNLKQRPRMLLQKTIGFTGVLRGPSIATSGKIILNSQRGFSDSFSIFFNDFITFMELIFEQDSSQSWTI